MPTSALGVCTPVLTRDTDSQPEKHLKGPKPPKLLPQRSRFPQKHKGPFNPTNMALVTVPLAPSQLPRTSSLASPIDANRVVHALWLLKRSHKTRQWQRRWVVLRNCQLSYYKDLNEHKPCRVISRSHLLSYSAIAGSHNYHFAVYTSNRVLHLRADTLEAYVAWLAALEAFVEHDGPAHANDTSTVHDAEFSGSDDGHGSSSVSDGSRRADEAPVEDIQALSLDPYEYVIEKGYLLRLRKRYNQWRRLYVVLTNTHVYFRRHSNQKTPHRTVLVAEIVDVIELDPLLRSKRWCLMVITPTKRMRFCAASEDEMVRWLAALKALAAQHGDR